MPKAAASAKTKAKPKPRSTKPFPMSARFGSVCKNDDCRARIEPGDRITYFPEEKKAQCWTCTEKGGGGEIDEDAMSALVKICIEDAERRWENTCPRAFRGPRDTWPKG